MFGIKPYKTEGGTLLYRVKDINNVGINYKLNHIGFTPIPKFEDKFWINKDGIILNVFTSQIVKTYIGTDLYEHVIFRYYGKTYRKRVHSLMGKTFLGNPPVVNHKDGIKHHNKLFNLERATHKTNIQHAYDNDYYTSRGGKGTPIIVTNKKTNITTELTSLRKAEKFTGVDRHRIKNIINNKNINNTNWEFKFK